VPASNVFMLLQSVLEQKFFFHPSGRSVRLDFDNQHGPEKHSSGHARELSVLLPMYCHFLLNLQVPEFTGNVHSSTLLFHLDINAVAMHQTIPVDPR
jgi:hypothetical protein